MVDNGAAGSKNQVASFLVAKGGAKLCDLGQQRCPRLLSDNLESYVILILTPSSADIYLLIPIMHY